MVKKIVSLMYDVLKREELEAKKQCFETVYTKIFDYLDGNALTILTPECPMRYIKYNLAKFVHQIGEIALVSLPYPPKKSIIKYSIYGN